MVLHEVITTEKVPFTYRVAGLGARFVAWCVDVGIIAVLLFMGACLGSVAELGRAGMGRALMALWIFLLNWGYFLLCEWLWHGQTLGKHLLGIRVITWQGTSMSFGQSLLRNVLRVADGLPIPVPFFYTLGSIVAACNREHRRLGDLAAGTLVVHVERRSKPIQAVHQVHNEAERSWRMHAQQRLNQLDRTQKQTILDLCLRRDQLRVAERARLFQATSEFFQERLNLSPEQHQSDEKFVLALASEIGARGAENTEPAVVAK
jgi:uncharacterized RDD family membrane protein YckC